MSEFLIEEVAPEGAKILLMLCGVSGGGKTYSALQLALGLTGGDAKKIGFLDTENGRGKWYARNMPEKYQYINFRAPFSPDRYIKAIEAFEKTDVSVLIIDSGSHEYEGIGGLQEIAERGNPKIANWNKAKAEHKKLMSKLLSTPMHVILCLRAREKARPERQWVNGQEKTVFVSEGLQAITEKNVLFEATASLMLSHNGKKQQVIKCPDDLMPILGRGEGYLTKEDGAALLDYINGFDPVDPEVTRAMFLLQGASESGLKSLQEAWAALPAQIRKKIGGCPEDLKAAAKAFDDQQPEANKVKALVSA